MSSKAAEERGHYEELLKIFQEAQGCSFVSLCAEVWRAMQLSLSHLCSSSDSSPIHLKITFTNTPVSNPSQLTGFPELGLGEITSSPLTGALLG